MGREFSVQLRAPARYGGANGIDLQQLLQALKKLGPTGSSVSKATPPRTDDLQFTSRPDFRSSAPRAELTGQKNRAITFLK
jgi:hypothetical protein